RVCSAACAVVVSIDADDRVVAVQGDRDDPQTLGFVCSKGTTAPEAHNGDKRLLHPLKRMADGSFAPIPLEQALDEIADRLRAIIDSDGPQAVSLFKGSGGFMHAASLMLARDWLTAIGSHQYYSTLTIDQSAKVVTADRLGNWQAGKPFFQTNDVAILFGANPLVSITQLDSRHPNKRLKEARDRGLKLIIVDPRRTETAELADIHIQPLPGHDAAIAAAMLRIILEQGWHDADFCAEHVEGLDALRAVAAPFTAEHVARIADIEPEILYEAAEAFARTGTLGVASTGTGVDMSAHSNLAEHLIECLNVVCGRFIREGDEIGNPGFIWRQTGRRAQVNPPTRSWEQGPKTRTGGYGLIGGEMATGVLADEILKPGPGRIRAMINHGGNPAVTVPDQHKIVAALRSLDLLVTIEPFLTPTARLSDYILPPRMFFERADLPIFIFETFMYPKPYTRYTPPLVAPPEGSEVCEEHLVFWGLAKRLGVRLSSMGVPLDMENPPSEDDVLATITGGAPLPYAEIKRRPLGTFYNEGSEIALPRDPETAGYFAVMPDDVRADMTTLYAETLAGRGRGFGHLLSNRRTRHRFNSYGFAIDGLTRLQPRNLAYMSPDDMAAQAFGEGDTIEIRSAHGAVEAAVSADPALRRGVVSMSHGFGGLPGDHDYRTDGASANVLISSDEDRQAINGMPLMSSVPVNVRRASASVPSSN
ncbi:MAG: hypothetical protein JWR77_660, partial [Rhizorhabdus sp.]|nr:hypothetical protein [Rhizorhabdus sp.]